ncbi:calcium-binding protein [Streptomyces sp. Rer75]|nr:calcium-binding protein [Streptomyces sp. Rer75]
MRFGKYSRRGELSALEGGDRMGALLDQKYEKLFALLDANGDGVIAEDDFELMGGRVLAAVDEERTAAKGKEYADALMTYWRALRETADADGDGRIDKGEFRQALHQVSDHFEMLIGPLYRAGFHLADRDDDGLVGREDFVAVISAVGVPEAEAGAAFDRLAEHGGQLTKDQLMTAASQYYRDEDPANSASHLLFGAL